LAHSYSLAYSTLTKTSYGSRLQHGRWRKVLMLETEKINGKGVECIILQQRGNAESRTIISLTAGRISQL
jgi:hypothetical protein